MWGADAYHRVPRSAPEAFAELPPPLHTPPIRRLGPGLAKARAEPRCDPPSLLFPPVFRRPGSRPSAVSLSRRSARLPAPDRRKYRKVSPTFSSLDSSQLVPARCVVLPFRVFPAGIQFLRGSSFGLIPVADHHRSQPLTPASSPLGRATEAAAW